MYDFNNNEDPNIERIINLFSFILLLHDFPQQEHSPDYILEKWNYWIGEDVVLTPNVIHSERVASFACYKQKWGDNCENVKLIYYFLIGLENLNILNCLADFNHLGGDLLNVSTQKKTGLHALLKVELVRWLEANELNIKAILRDINIADILAD